MEEVQVRVRCSRLPLLFYHHSGDLSTVYVAVSGDGNCRAHTMEMIFTLEDRC